MDYQKIYNDICKRGQNRILPKEEYTEKHHIIPKCLGGTEDRGNLTVLTAKEHYICHLILARKLHPLNPKLWSAMHYMIVGNLKHNKRYIGTSRNYEQLRIEVNKMRSGVPRTDEVKIKIGNAKRGKKLRPEYLQKVMENPARGVKLLHLETGLVFNSQNQAASYFDVSRWVIETQIKNGIFKKIQKANTDKLSVNEFVNWLAQYIKDTNLLDKDLIQIQLNKIK